MECMHPTSVSQGCCVIQEGDDGSTVYVLEGAKRFSGSSINYIRDTEVGVGVVVFILVFILACLSCHKLSCYTTSNICCHVINCRVINCLC